MYATPPCLIHLGGRSLHPGQLPSAPILPCRAPEQREIESFLHDCLSRSAGGSLFIAGSPGVGKTAVMVRGLRRQWWWRGAGRLWIRQRTFPPPPFSPPQARILDALPSWSAAHRTPAPIVHSYNGLTMDWSPADLNDMLARISQGVKAGVSSRSGGNIATLSSGVRAATGAAEEDASESDRESRAPLKTPKRPRLAVGAAGAGEGAPRGRAAARAASPAAASPQVHRTPASAMASLTAASPARAAAEAAAAAAAALSRTKWTWAAASSPGAAGAASPGRPQPSAAAAGTLANASPRAAPPPSAMGTPSRAPASAAAPALTTPPKASAAPAAATPAKQMHIIVIDELDGLLRRGDKQQAALQR